MIPKNFIPGKKEIGKARKDLLTIGKARKDLLTNVDRLFKGYEEYLLLPYNYTYAKSLTEDILYSKRDLQLFCNRLMAHEDRKNFSYTGMYLSALVNKVIKEWDEITLELPRTRKDMDYIGVNLVRGRFVIKGNVGSSAGMNMAGGDLIIQGRAGQDTGAGMIGGRLYAEKIWRISSFYNSGEIYENGRKLRPL